MQPLDVAGAVSEDERFETISEPAMLLFLLLKPHADDAGIICIDKTQVIRSKVYAVREDVTIQMVRDRIAELEDHDFIRIFKHGTGTYAALDFSDEKIDKPRPGILPDGLNFQKLQPKKADSVDSATPLEASRTVANGSATGGTPSETPRNDSRHVESIRDDSRTFALERRGKEREKG